jgi:hypothetical protein
VFHVERRPRAWTASAVVPFDAGWSKNRMWLARHQGGRRLSPEARARRDALVRLLRPQVGEVVRNALWLRLDVRKADHLGDALNALDLVADAVEIATGLDDRWFQLDGVEWTLGRPPGELMVTAWQEEGLADATFCAGCGRLLPPDSFRLEPLHQATCRTCARLKYAERVEARRRRLLGRGPPEPDPDPGSAPPWRR